MGDSGSQVLGFLLAALGLAASWTTAGTTVATMLLPLLVLAIPILDTTLVTVIAALVERRPVTQGGKDHTSHRLVYYGLSEREAVALLATIAIALGATGLAYNVLDNGARDRGRRARHVRPARPVRQLPRRAATSARAAARPATRPVAAALTVRAAPPDRDARRLRAHLRLVPRGVRRSSSRAREAVSAAVDLPRALPVVLGTRYVVLRPAGIYRRVWRFATTTDELVIAAACALSAVVSWGIVVSSADRSRCPRRVFVLDAIVCTLLVGAPGCCSASGWSGANGTRRRETRSHPDRRSRTLRAELRPRDARDGRQAGRRLPRRQPGHQGAPPRRHTGARLPRRGGARDRAGHPGRGARHDRRRAGGAPRAGDRSVRGDADTLPRDAPRDRDGNRCVEVPVE